MCECCGRPFPAAVTAAALAGVAATSATTGAETVRPLCRLCRDGYYAFDRARSYGLYDDALHHAILLLKYEEVTRLAIGSRRVWRRLWRVKARRSERT